MQKKINILTGQSNFDKCLQAEGGFDGFINFLNDNEIENSSIPKTTDYAFDTNNTKNSSYIGYPYSTRNINVCSIITGLSVGTITDSSIEFSWDSTIGIFGYEWFITTTNIAPSGSGTITYSNSVTIIGLNQLTQYYFWIRTVCSIGFVSSFISLSETTISGPPVSPVTSGLVGFYVSSYGVSLDGLGNVTSWQDQSGNSNDLIYSSGTKAIVNNAIFGAEPAIFVNVSGYKTSGNFVGIGTPSTQKLTVFLVLQFSLLPSAQAVLDYSLSGFSTITDGFIIEIANPLSLPEFDVLLKGDVGFNGSTVGTSFNTGVIYQTIFNKGGSAANEIDITAYFHGGTSSTSGSSGSDNSNDFGTYPLNFGYSPTVVGCTAKVGCLMIFNRQLNNTEISTMETYLRTKYSIT